MEAYINDKKILYFLSEIKETKKKKRKKYINILDALQNMPSFKVKINIVRDF